MIADVQTESAKVRLELHPDKTKIQHNNIGYGSGVTSEAVGKMNIEVLAPTESNLYLGRALALTNVHDLELDHRLRKAWAKYGTFKEELTNKAFSFAVAAQTLRVGCHSDCNVWSWIVGNDNGQADEVAKYTAEDGKMYFGPTSADFGKWGYGDMG